MTTAIVYVVVVPEAGSVVVVTTGPVDMRRRGGPAVAVEFCTATEYDPVRVFWSAPVGMSHEYGMVIVQVAPVVVGVAYLDADSIYVVPPPLLVSEFSTKSEEQMIVRVVLAGQVDLMVIFSVTLRLALLVVDALSTGASGETAWKIPVLVSS